jgi:phosphohistidine phosphatase SixA
VGVVTVYLVRHASAGARNVANPYDSERVLDDGGRAQAELLAELLGDRQVTRVISSPALRCVQTVEPLADALGVPVEQHEALREGSDLEPAWALLEWAAAQPGDVVLCSHGDLIPELIRRAQLRGMEVPGRSGSSKGSVWALRWDGERFAEGTYTPVKATV